jgi:hypothetical protein
MKVTGNLLKMVSRLADPVEYTLVIGGDYILANDLIGKEINLEFRNQINCIACGRETKTSFFQGYCFPCFSTLPETDTCVMQPETCRAHEGISRDMEWSKHHCLVDHIVYLALTSSVKVGVTRESQVPTRWIDQGAWKVIRLARTPNRYLAGLLEVTLKSIYTDKTSWQKMLKDQRDGEHDLLEEKERAWEILDPDLQEFFIEDDDITTINYPVTGYPDKVKSVTFDKLHSIEGILKGIRGQYLIFDNNLVFNVRRHNGYLVNLNVI